MTTPADRIQTAHFEYQPINSWADVDDTNVIVVYVDENTDPQSLAWPYAYGTDDYADPKFVEARTTGLFGGRPIVAWLDVPTGTVTKPALVWQRTGAGATR